MTLLPVNNNQKSGEFLMKPPLTRSERRTAATSSSAAPGSSRVCPICGHVRPAAEAPVQPAGEAGQQCAPAIIFFFKPQNRAEKVTLNKVNDIHLKQIFKIKSLEVTLSF